MIPCIFQISKENCRDLVAMDCIQYEESIYSRKRMSRISHICCNVSLTWLRAVKRPWSELIRTSHEWWMSAEIACFLQDPIFGHGFFGMIFTWNWEDVSLFECKCSDSVLYNYVRHTNNQRHYIFYSTKCATVNTLPFNWYFEGSVMGEGMCLHCLFMLTSFN